MAKSGNELGCWEEGVVDDDDERNDDGDRSGEDFAEKGEVQYFLLDYLLCLHFLRDECLMLD